MMFVGLIYLYLYWRNKEKLHSRWFLWLVGLCTPLGFIAVEAGWTVTEVGRQPWIIYGIMKTEEAVSTMPGLQYPFFIFTAVYVLLTILVTWLMYRQIITLADRYETAK
jgi:cytochrome d ubiquinol oxidase subunit I